MEVSVLDIKGQETGRKVALNDAVFGIEPNDHVLYHEHAAGGSAGDGQGQHPALHHHAGGEYEEARADPARSQPARGTRSQQHGEGGGVCLQQGVCDP